MEKKEMLFLLLFEALNECFMCRSKMRVRLYGLYCGLRLWEPIALLCSWF